MSENRQNQPRTNELLHFLVISFWDYKLNLQKVSDKPESLLFKRIKPDKNNPWKIIVWEIPSTKEEKNVSTSRRKISYWQVSINWKYIQFKTLGSHKFSDIEVIKHNVSKRKHKLQKHLMMQYETGALKK